MAAVCHACSHTGGEICTATFFCWGCGRDREVCSHLPGGLEAFTPMIRAGGGECVMCQEKGMMSEAWIDKWHKKKAG
jgi:hypothetical protein